MDYAFTAPAGLVGLFLASFFSATLLPGGSEAVLVAVMLAHPQHDFAALLVATVGNTLGGMVTFFMGRLLPQNIEPRKSALARRRGPPILLLAWAPIIGDALCAAAGWLRLPPLTCALWMAIGKAGRYALVVAGVAMV